jgi:myo-inositol 2-dehydrogenase/D-chiro-inositol 1-dehydrogenase
LTLKPIGIGILGGGYAGNVHAENLSKDPRAKLVAICESRSDEARLFSCRYNTRAYAAYQDLLSDPEVEAVYITTPNALHSQQAISAIKAGKNVFCEKPMAITLEGAKEVLEAVRGSGVKYQIGLSRRFWPVYKFIRRLIERESLTPYLCDIKMSRGELKRPIWVGDDRVSGGFLFESVLHVLDLVRWLVGDVSAVSCHATSSIYPQLDDFAMVLRTSNGRLASVTSSAHATWAFPFERVEIYGDHCCVMTEEATKVIYSSGLEKEVEVHDFSQLPRNRLLGFEEEDGLFVDSILTDKKAAVDEVEAYRSIELVEACYRSARSGESVKLPL